MTNTPPELRSAVKNFFSRTDIYFPPIKEEDRLWAHDSIHTLLGVGSSSISEETVGIYQAVLLRSKVVTQRQTPHCDGHQQITLDTIHETILPRVKEFVGKLALRFNFKVGPNSHLNDNEIKDTYEKAKIVAALFKNKYGMHMGEMPLSDYLSLPIDDVQALYDLATHMQRGSNLPLPTVTQHRDVA